MLWISVWKGCGHPVDFDSTNVEYVRMELRISADHRAQIRPRGSASAYYNDEHMFDNLIRVSR